MQHLKIIKNNSFLMGYRTQYINDVDELFLIINQTTTHYILYIDPQERGNGVGSAFIRQYLNQIGNNSQVDVLFARLDSNCMFDIQYYYSKFGFKTVWCENGEAFMVNKHFEFIFND